MPMETILHPILEDFDLNLHAQVEPERTAVEQAKGRRDELKRELSRLETALERRRTQAQETRLLEDAGVEPEAVDVASVEDGVKAKREELEAAETALSDAKEALGEKMEALRSDLAEEVKERRNDAEKQVAGGLTMAVRANLELFALNVLVRHADLPVGVSYSRTILPDGLKGYNSLSAQTKVGNDLTERVRQWMDKGQIGREGMQSFRGDLVREAQKAAPIEDV